MVALEDMKNLEFIKNKIKKATTEMLNYVLWNRSD